jgi:hypothetical protein
VHASLLVLNKGRPSLMLNRRRESLLAFQILFYFSDSLGHSSLLYASPLLKYKCSAHLRLYAMIIALIVY